MVGVLDSHEVVRVLNGYLGVDCCSVYLAVKAVQQTAQKLLGILLTAADIPGGTRESGAAIHQSWLNNLGRRAGGSHLLAAHKLRRVFLDLTPEVGRTDGIGVDWSPQVLGQFCKLWYHRVMKGLGKIRAVDYFAQLLVFQAFFKLNWEVQIDWTFTFHESCAGSAGCAVVIQVGAVEVHEAVVSQLLSIAETLQDWVHKTLKKKYKTTNSQQRPQTRSNIQQCLLFHSN